MAPSSRRFFLPAALALCIALLSADRLAVPGEVNAIFDPNGPAWDPLSTFDTSENPVPVRYPPRLLAGTNSHDLPADAATRNGYCLDVNVGDIAPATGAVTSTTADGVGVSGSSQLGFFVFASDPIDPANPLQAVAVPLPATGLYVDGPYVPAPGDPVPPAVDFLNTGEGSSADDVYCVVVQAPEGYQTLNIEWHYTLNGDPQPPVALPEIPIVTVTLEKIGDGIFGSPAEVCTVGWDSAFLTGSTSNAGGLLGATPDPIDDVRISDFVPSGGSVNVFVDYVRPVGTEWCAGIGSTTVESDVQVTFEFDAVYNRVNIGTTRDHDADDQPRSVSLPGNRLIDIKDVIELRHVTSDGYIPPRNPSDLIVINSMHTICVAGTDAGDTLTANNVHFVALSGDPGVSNLTIFNKTAAAQPDLVGVLDGTLCFSYTSGGTGEQAVFVTFSNNGIPTNAEFDTDDDGNGLPGLDDTDAGPLIVRWAGIDTTIITLGGSPTEPGNDVTFERIELPATFNLADGTFIAGASIREWVLGPPGTGGSPTERGLISGALLRARVVSECGYFVVPDDSRPTEMTGRSVGGQFELSDWTLDSSDLYLGDTDSTADAIEFSTLNDTGCIGTSVVRIEIEAFLPDATGSPVELEWVEFALSDFQPGMKVPVVAWAGQFVEITYAIASDEECEGQEVLFVRPDDQPGSFMPGPGIVLDGPGSAIGTFDDSCSASVRYESEEPGEVDVEAFLEGNDFSKFAFPIFFLAFEDITVEATPDQFVSTFGDVTARLRGYFPGSNPSGRPQETKADGRTVPADRWVLPDDWERLKGVSEFRAPWGGVNMPEAIITFFMENENVMNNYKAGVKHGAAGFFIPDSPEDFSFNVNPHTQATTLLGTPTKPRMMSSRTDAGGEASVDTFGDRNLSFEECAANAITGNPHCEPEDIVGRTRYFAVAEYPQVGNRGKWPAIASNVAETVWLWAGYKAVTVVNTDSPQIKYVVAHLRDRDGFCDAANFNNTLGVPVDFQIDAGGGVIIEAADRPFTINGTRQFATATTFDTTDANDRPINTHIARPPLFAEQPDECQAWIKITNSLLVPTNVLVTFPAPPSPIPGDIRITNLQCEGQETITVQNFGSNEVNLGGFALESAGTDIGNAEQVDLIGILQPGESKTFLGGPGAPENNWIGSGSEVFGGANDFAALTWEDYALTTVFCDGTRVDQSPLVSLPLDGEGEIQLDIIIPFGSEIEVPLVAGWNMVATGEGTVAIETAFAEFLDKVEAIYVWDPELAEWSRFIPGMPDGMNTIDTIGAGTFMWVLAKEPFTLTLPK